MSYCWVVTRGYVSIVEIPLVWLALAGPAADHALLLDLHATIPWDEWPMHAQTSPVRVRLKYQGQAFTVQAGRRLEHGWNYDP